MFPRLDLEVLKTGDYSWPAICVDFANKEEYFDLSSIVRAVFKQTHSKEEKKSLFLTPILPPTNDHLAFVITGKSQGGHILILRVGVYILQTDNFQKFTLLIRKKTDKFCGIFVAFFATILIVKCSL